MKNEGVSVGKCFRGDQALKNAIFETEKKLSKVKSVVLNQAFYGLDTKGGKKGGQKSRKT